MPANRYYTPQDFYEESIVELEPSEAMHLKTVMRNQVDDQVELVNGKGLLGQAIVSQITKKGVFLKIVNLERIPFPKDLVLGIGFLVQDRLDVILEKGCELGMTQLVLIRTENVGKEGFTDAQVERMRRVLIAALKQSGRYWLPSIDLKKDLKSFIEGNDQVYFGDIDSSSPPFFEVFDLKAPFKLLVGPAKGFSSDEIDLMKNSSVCTGVYLSDAVLRAETAAILMIGLASHAFLLK
jgi:16S rRNA (uracil1498-N3)-methyltransferase